LDKDEGEVVEMGGKGELKRMNCKGSKVRTGSDGTEDRIVDSNLVGKAGNGIYFGNIFFEVSN
jgi:hypothetical protein